MAAAWDTCEPSGNNYSVIISAYKLFSVLHDKKISSSEKLEQIIEVLSCSVDVDINFRDRHDNRNSLLHGAVAYGYVDLVKLLLFKGADVNRTNDAGETPLHLVSSSKRFNRNRVGTTLVRLLVRFEADVNIKTGSGETALHLAVNRSCISVIREIIKKADVTIQNTDGQTSLDLAKEKKNMEIISIFESRIDQPDSTSLDATHPGQNADMTSVDEDDNYIFSFLGKDIFDINNGMTSSVLIQPRNRIASPTPPPLTNVCPVIERAREFRGQLGTGASSRVPTSYNVAGAKMSIHGTVYQLCLLMLLTLRALVRGCVFYLGTEVREAEQFDDIVLIYQSPNTEGISTLLVQAKHTDNAAAGIGLDDLLTNKKNAKFSLLKYYKSYVKIKERMGDRAGDIDFAICTNTYLKFDEYFRLVGKYFKLSFEQARSTHEEFFKGGQCFKIVTDDVTLGLLRDDFLRRLESEITELGDEYKQENEKIVSALENYKHTPWPLNTFLQNLIFVVGQPAENDSVKTEFRTYSETNLIDADLLTDSFYKQIFDWFSMKKGEYLTNESAKEKIQLIISKVNHFMSSGISRVYAERVLTLPYKFKIEKLNQLENIISNNTIVHLKANIETNLTQLQVAQMLQNSHSFAARDSLILMHLNSLLLSDTKKLTISAFKSAGSFDLLIIDCLTETAEVSQSKLTAVGFELLKIISNNPQKKLILMASEEFPLANMLKDSPGYYLYPVGNVFEDFSKETQDMFLAAPVTFQGQSTKLGQVISETETDLLAIVPLEALIGDEGLVIGQECRTPVGYNEKLYVKRSFKYKIEIRTSIFKDKLQIKFQDCIAKTEAKFQHLCNTVPNVHYLENEGSRYFWVKSQGELKELRPYIDYGNTHACSEELFLAAVKLQRVVIISATAGMGKSTVLTHISKIIQSKRQGTLVCRLDLNNYSEILEKEISTRFNHSSAIDFLYNMVNAFGTPLEKALLQRKGKVVLMFDGFDEISPNYNNIVLDLIQNLKEATEAQIWITTRPIMREELENKLHQFSCTLKPFSEENKTDFLSKYWKHNMTGTQESKGEEIKFFAESLNKQFSESISDKEGEFTGIPLQIRMVAECFVDDFKNPHLEISLQLVDLYDKFIMKKFEVFHIVKNGIDITKVGARLSQKKISDLYMKQHQYLAFVELFSEEMRNVLFSEDANIKDCPETITNLNRIGIVGIMDRKPHFIHRTFAEYLVAVYIMELLKQHKTLKRDVQHFILSELLINENYMVIRKFLDGLLRKDQLPRRGDKPLRCKIPISVQTIENHDQVFQQIFIHTAIEGNNEIFLSFGACVKIVLGPDYRQYLSLCIDNNKNETLLHLAVKNRRISYIKTLLQWISENMYVGQYILKVLITAKNKRGYTALHSASMCGWDDVVSTLLQWTRYNMNDGEEIVKIILLQIGYSGETALQGAAWSAYNNVVKTILQWTCDNTDQDQNLVKLILLANETGHGTVLQRAFVFGSDVVALTVLQWTRDNVNQCQEVLALMLLATDIKGHTVLHSASSQGDDKFVQTILKWICNNMFEGRDMAKSLIFAADRNGETALHCSSRLGHKNVAQMLLERTRDNTDQTTLKSLLFAVGKNGDTTLHEACRCGKNDVATLLLQWTRDNLGEETMVELMRVRNWDGKSAMHLALSNGKDELVEILKGFVPDA